MTVALGRWLLGGGWKYASMGLAVLAFGLWLVFHDRHVIAEHDKDVQIQVQATSSAAAENAHTAVDQARNETERTNDDARKAAIGSTDPLKSGLDRLRSESPHRPTPGRPH